jgi:hypothetical protein
MYEHRTEPLLPFRTFLRRFVRHLLLATSLVLGSLVIGVVGYHGFEQIPWIDSLLNASMILGGMGPVTELHTTGGKLFASFYALFSGIVFLVTAGIVIAPLAHRLLHHLHLEQRRDRAGGN